MKAWFEDGHRHAGNQCHAANSKGARKMEKDDSADMAVAGARRRMLAMMGGRRLETSHLTGGCLRRRDRMDGWRRPAIQMEAPPLRLTDGQSTRYRVGFKLQGGGFSLGFGMASSKSRGRAGQHADSW